MRDCPLANGAGEPGRARADAASFRVDVVRRYLGPAPAWYTREQVEGHVPYILQAHIVEAQATDTGARLTLKHADGSVREISADHVVAATGYRVDTQKLTFLGDRIQAGLGRVAGAPALSRNFESTVRGLYFVGTSAANSFGPMLRFVNGTEFASRRVTNHIAPAIWGHSSAFSTKSRKILGIEASRQ